MARYNRNKSQHNLLIEIYGKNVTGTIKNANEADSGIKSIPFSLLHTGYYYYANGTRGGRELYGSYRESYAISETDAYYLSFYSTYFHPQNTYSKGYGFSLRCVAKFATDSICPKGWEMARYDGDGSYQNFLIDVYAITIMQWDGNRLGVPNSGANNGITRFPLTFNLAGYYYQASGRFNQRGNENLIWEKENSKDLGYSTIYLLPQTSIQKGRGNSLRCVAKCGDATDSICPKESSGHYARLFDIFLQNNFRVRLIVRRFEQQKMYIPDRTDRFA